MKKLIVLPLIFLVSCQPVRKPASQANDLKKIVEQFHERVQEPINSMQECLEVLPYHYQKLFALDWDEVGLLDYHERDLDRIVGLSFEIRLKMKEQVTRIGVATGDSYDCLKESRNVFRSLRYLEDYVIEHLESRGDKVLDESKYTTLEGRAPYFLVNPKFNFRDWKDLQSGDVIISRGNAYTSAAIARIGDMDAQFSHLTMVYKDENGELHTSEAHIEIGSVSKPFQVHLDQRNARSVVLRFKGSKELAHKAAKHVYDRVKNHSTNKRKNISYDFGMNYKNHDDLFCSEVVYEGYEIASNGELDIPLNKTKFNPKLIRFLKQIGVEVTEDNIETFLTFSPGDTEFDPNFDVVAEWRNPARMSDTRQKDAVLTKMMDWMENENYYFRPKFMMSAQAYMGFALRRVPILNNGLREKIPLNMKPKQIKLFVALEEVAETLHQELIDQELSLGRPMTFKEMFETLEHFRKVDEQAYEIKKKDARFHRLFRRVD
tara:strand:+ start:21284 stop:22753 length:1470 start_codon:yes stop_codon:yes gene_type:complete